jgi:hypothetical protein
MTLNLLSGSKYFLYFASIIGYIMFPMFAQKYILDIAISGYMLVKTVQETQTESEASKSDISKSWVTFGTLFVARNIMDCVFMLLPFGWMYTCGKLGAYVWFMYSDNASQTVYNKFIAPPYEKHKVLINDMHKIGAKLIETASKDIISTTYLSASGLFAYIKENGIKMPFKHRVLSEISKIGDEKTTDIKTETIDVKED